MPVYIIPSIIAVKILAVKAMIKRFQRLLDANCLRTIGIIKHDTNWLITSCSNGLETRVLFGYVISIGCCIPPLNFNGPFAFNETINLKYFRALSDCILNPKRAGLRKFLHKAQFGSLFQE